MVLGCGLLFAYPWLAPVLGVDGPPTVWFHIVAGIVLVFGYAYARIAQDSQRYRPYIVLGAAGKLTFAAVIYAHWIAGSAPGPVAVLVSADVVFAALFLAFLRSHPA